MIHLITPFSRPENVNLLVEAYRPMNVILHPITFYDELIHFPDEEWIKPYVINTLSKDCKAGTIAGYKRNQWIKNNTIVDDDYYVTADDDDMYEAGVFDAIKQMDNDIVIISSKRGDFTPVGVIEARRYPTYTLFAHPDNIKIGSISSQQSFVKGKIFKNHLFEEDTRCEDGLMAIHHHEDGEQIRYEPDLYALFNYFEPGRWIKPAKVAFGCMVNNVKRFDLILKGSSIEGCQCFTVFDPESATKGLNTLLDTIDKTGAEIGILTHQDMFYQQHWLPQVKSQIEKLPSDWVIAGIVGKDEKGQLCGRFHDMSSPLWIVTDHTFPARCSCIDECTIIVNMKSGFRFDEALKGFDLYGTYACLRANEIGSAWILDAWAEHYCSRFWGEWEPDEVFMRMWQWLYKRFPGKRLESTVLIGEENN